MINWKVTKAEARCIHEIAERAARLADTVGHEYRVGDAIMDITACHANAFRLSLVELRDADQFNFAHDVFGIYRHINRETGQLEDCFVPRYSLGKREAVRP